MHVSFKSLKDSIPYSQTLRIKTICSTTSELNNNCDIITKRFKEWGYPKNLVNEQVDKVKNMKRKQLPLTSNKKTIQNCIPMSIIYNRNLPNISKIFTKIGTFCKYRLLFKKCLTRNQWKHIKETKFWRAYRRSHSTRRRSLQDSPSNN